MINKLDELKGNIGVWLSEYSQLLWDRAEELKDHPYVLNYEQALVEKHTLCATTKAIRDLLKFEPLCEEFEETAAELDVLQKILGEVNVNELYIQTTPAELKLVERISQVEQEVDTLLQYKVDVPILDQASTRVELLLSLIPIDNRGLPEELKGAKSRLVHMSNILYNAKQKSERL
ncbi:hypothetical protein Goe20_01700 [Bacillus phage vB_BsuM-Goe20]|nr:hypothetical protein Goe20_01700 [Bacillus phage vB_BsuM-Goe20]